MKILYLHGLGSGAESRTPKLLRDYLTRDEIFAPEIPIDPEEAYDFVLKTAGEYQPDVVAGTSLGGFYAMALHGTFKLLVNPAMYADEDIEDRIGLGTKEFFAQRADGSKTYEIDRAFISKLASVRKKIYAGIDDADKACTFALFARKDSLPGHYYDFAAEYDARSAEYFDGEHRLSPENVRDVVAPKLRVLRAKAYDRARGPRIFEDAFGIAPGDASAYKERCKELFVGFEPLVRDRYIEYFTDPASIYTNDEFDRRESPDCYADRLYEFILLLRGFTDARNTVDYRNVYSRVADLYYPYTGYVPAEKFINDGILKYLSPPQLTSLIIAYAGTFEHLWHGSFLSCCERGLIGEILVALKKALRTGADKGQRAQTDPAPEDSFAPDAGSAKTDVPDTENRD